MTRPAVHALSGHRLGDPDPRQEGPADLRLVPLAAATWAAAAVALGAPGRWTALGVLTLLSAAGALLVRSVLRPAARTRRLGGVAVAGALLCAAAGALSAGLYAADLHRGPVPGLAAQYARVTAELTVVSDPRPVRPAGQGDPIRAGGLLLDTEIIRVRAPGGAVTAARTPVLLIVPAGRFREEWLRVLPSTDIRLAGVLSPPSGSGDRRAAVLRAEGTEPPRIIAPPSRPQRLAGVLRAGLRTATQGLPSDARALLPGLVVGDTSRISTELHDAFRATDLTHVIAVSGSNLSVVLTLLIGPAGLALRAERRGVAAHLGIPLRLTACLGGVLTLVFVVVCRPEPSVLRAAACGLITLLAIGTGRRRTLIPALAAAVLLLLLIDPWLARSYGFLLSVLATASLLTLAPRWSAALRRGGMPGRLAEVLAAAGAAQAVCAPVVAVFAARVGLVAIPCNLFAELALAPATILGFAALALAPLSLPAAELTARCAGVPAGWIASVARAGASLPGAEAAWPGGWWGGLLLAVLTLFVLAAARHIPGRPWTAAGCAVLLLFVVVRPPQFSRIVTGWPPPGWAFAMCDVGQGDATVLAAGDGTAVVVDTGPDPELADRCLRDLGVTRIPLLLLTHFHADHVGGLPGVLRGRSVGSVETTALREPLGQSAFVARTAAAARVPVVTAGAGERRRFGPLSWQVLWPPPPPLPHPPYWPPSVSGGLPEPVALAPNDASVALLVQISHGPSLLLLGDLEPPSQQGLLRLYPGLPPTEVVKVAHHGSAHQDPGLFRAIRARLALISCGRDNGYGHPSPTTVAALRAGGAMVLRTDRDGAIAVAGSGPTLRVLARGTRAGEP